MAQCSTVGGRHLAAPGERLGSPGFVLIRTRSTGLHRGACRPVSGRSPANVWAVAGQCLGGRRPISRRSIAVIAGPLMSPTMAPICCRMARIAGADGHIAALARQCLASRRPLSRRLPATIAAVAGHYRGGFQSSSRGLAASFRLTVKSPLGDARTHQRLPVHRQLPSVEHGRAMGKPPNASGWVSSGHHRRLSDGHQPTGSFSWSRTRSRATGARGVPYHAPFSHSNTPAVTQRRADAPQPIWPGCPTWRLMQHRRCPPPPDVRWWS